MDWFVKAFIRASLAWFAAGILLGIAMAFYPPWVVYRPAHAHMNVVGFLTMMAARTLMGLAEGGLPPLTFAIVTSEVPPERRGLAVGLTSTIGLQAIPLLGPLTIVGIATLYGWRDAFWIAGIPGLIMAGAIWLWIRNPPHGRTDDTPKGSIIPLLKLRNIRFSMILATLNMTFYVALLGFGPLYLVNVAGISNAMMAAAMSLGT